MTSSEWYWFEELKRIAAKDFGFDAELWEYNSIWMRHFDHSHSPRRALECEHMQIRKKNAIK